MINIPIIVPINVTSSATDYRLPYFWPHYAHTLISLFSKHAHERHPANELIREFIKNLENSLSQLLRITEVSEPSKLLI